jgi:hypothetical protein
MSTSIMAGFSSTKGRTAVSFVGDMMFVSVLQQHVTRNEGGVAA